MLPTRGAPPTAPLPSKEMTQQPSQGTERNCISTPEELQVIKQVRAGDADAFNYLVNRYQQLAYSIAYRILHREDAAVDAVQDAFIKAFRALSGFRNGCFKSWLSRIVVNTCYDTLRKHDLQATTALDDLAPTDEGDVDVVATTESPEASLQRSEVRDWLEQGLQSLPVDQRIVVVLYDVHGYSYDEVAGITGVPLGTVKSRLSRGRLRLRDFLLDHDVLPGDLETAHGSAQHDRHVISA